MSNRCSYCVSPPSLMVSAGAGERAVLACAGHAGSALERVMRDEGMPHARAFYLGQFTWKPGLVPAEVYEQARRVGARSVRGGETGHLMEDQLHLAVLAAIAQGTPQAAELAQAALMTRHYEFERYT